MEETIQGRKLVKGGNYCQKYGMLVCICQNFNLLHAFQPITGEQTMIGQPQPRFYSLNGKFSKGWSLSIESIQMICKGVFVSKPCVILVVIDENLNCFFFSKFL